MGITKALKKLKAAKSNLQNMKLVVENNAKIKKEIGDLEKTEKIVANKMTLREKDKALAAVTEKVNKAVYAALSAGRITLKVKKLEAKLESVKKIKDDNKPALIKRALKRVQEAQ